MRPLPVPLSCGTGPGTPPPATAEVNTGLPPVTSEETPAAARSEKARVQVQILSAPVAHIHRLLAPVPIFFGEAPVTCKLYYLTGVTYFNILSPGYQEYISLALIFQELTSRDREDGRATGQTIVECGSRIADLGTKIEGMASINGHMFSP